MRRAKIVCTLGPASDSPEVIRPMIEAGMDVARLNFSHGSHESHRELYNRVRTIAGDFDRPVAIMQDLQGPKIRVGGFDGEFVELEEGESFTITTQDVLGDERRVSTTYEDLPRDVEAGDIVLLDDGLLRLRVTDVGDSDVATTVLEGGRLSDHKGINLPTTIVSAPALTEKDIADLEFGCELGVDYVALSFVQSGLDIHQLRSHLPADPEDQPQVVSKIEKPQAVRELEDIISVSDGIMIARGDLGVEMPPQEVPLIQKDAISRANAMGKLTITATQMLESMTEESRPTRAEASDVANAVLDGTGAVMLSGETAAGDHPVESVQMMSQIVEEVEENRTSSDRSSPEFLEHLETFPNAVAKAATHAADELSVEAIVAFTMSGATARLVMTYRPNKPIIACTPNPDVYHKLALYWGVESLRIDMLESTEEVLERVEGLMVEQLGASSGDEVIVVMGSPVGEGNETNLIKFHRIP